MLQTDVGHSVLDDSSATADPQGRSDEERLIGASHLGGSNTLNLTMARCCIFVFLGSRGVAMFAIVTLMEATLGALTICLFSPTCLSFPTLPRENTRTIRFTPLAPVGWTYGIS